MMPARIGRSWRVPALAVWMTAATLGQPMPAAAQEAGAASGQSRGPVDLTGYWVSVVTEDWRWRMQTPPRGDFASVPLNEEGQRVTNLWDPSRDGACEAYGAPGLLRIPGRLHITWENDTTLRLDTEAGQQTRRLHVGGAAPSGGAPTLQGYSTAQWERASTGPGGFDGLGARRSGDDPARGGFDEVEDAWLPLKVVTTGLRPGWLRKNGVPYSGDATLTEHFIRFSVPNGGEWLTVLTVVDDPTYLTEPFMTTTNFKREPDGANWNPTSCRE